MTILLLILALADVRPLTVQTICSTKWGTDQRHVSTAMRKAVFAAAGVPWAERRFYVVDHRVPRELAGADVLSNLQLQRLPIAKAKDRDENRLHREVCAGSITLPNAQREMRAWQ